MNGTNNDNTNKEDSTHSTISLSHEERMKRYEELLKKHEELV